MRYVEKKRSTPIWCPSLNLIPGYQSVDSYGGYGGGGGGSYGGGGGYIQGSQGFMSPGMGMGASPSVGGKGVCELIRGGLADINILSHCYSAVVV